MKMTNLSMSLSFWKNLVDELARRGKGTRESGAFLLGNVEDGRIDHFICYDDLDPSSLDSGIVVFNGTGYVRLWQFCDERKKKVLADVHTHPDDWVGQSFSDQTNPMINERGHVALIVPHYGRFEATSLRGVGIYVYQGDHRWKVCKPNSKRIFLTGI